MSLPLPELSVNNSQTTSTMEELNDSKEASVTPSIVNPAPEIEMEDANATQESNNVATNSIEVNEIAGEDDEDDDEEESLTLPLSKIKRIFKMDPDYLAATQSAVYATGLATELFIQYFTEQALVLAKMDKRKKLQYKDFSNAVASHDSLHFLNDTIPKTQPIGELIEKKKINVNSKDNKEARENGSLRVDEVHAEGPAGKVKKVNLLPKGQQTLDFAMDISNTAETQTPVKKSVISDIVTTDNDTEVTSKEATIEVEDEDVMMTN